jgi:hypothetical protein
MTQREEIKVLNIAQKYFNEMSVLRRTQTSRCSRYLDGRFVCFHAPDAANTYLSKIASSFWL